MAYQNTFKRKEIKYVLNEAQLAAVQHAMESTMQLDQYGLSTISNIYCDSPDFEMTRRSIEKPQYKEKLRLRSYGAVHPTDTVYLELKKKYNGTVYKRRLPLTLGAAMAYLYHGIRPCADCQVLREIDYTVQHYGAVRAVYVAYERMAYFGKENKEFRITLDFNIRGRMQNLAFGTDDACEVLCTQRYAVMEVKAAAALPAWLITALSENCIYPASFSKVGRIYTKFLMNNKEKNICLKAS